MTDRITIPETLVAGDGWAWSDASAFASHPPPDWSLRYVLRPVAGGDAVEIVATWGDGAYRLSLGASASAGIAPGDYDWSAVAFHDALDDRALLGSGRVTVKPDPLAENGDLRSAAERILAAIEATLEGRATKDADSYSIEGRSISRTPMADLLRLRTVYQREVRAERGASPFQYRRVKI